MKRAMAVSGVILLFSLTVTVPCFATELTSGGAKAVLKELELARKTDNFRFVSLKLASKVKYAFNRYGNYVYSECDLDHTFVVVRYKRTRRAEGPYFWFLKQTPDGKVVKGFFARCERAVRARDWDYYWDVLVGYEPQDPTRYEEWWEFVEYVKVPKESLTVYITLKSPIGKTPLINSLESYAELLEKADVVGYVTIPSSS